MKLTDKIEITNEDNMLLMARYPDNYFDLAIVDPPYGIGDRLVDGGGKDIMKKYKESFKEKKWDDAIPPKEYFIELMRVSKNQIIWGGNYFIEHLYNTRGIICWDKKQMMETLSRWEFGWTSFDKVAKTYEIRSQDVNRFHPTAKPIQLYKWLLDNYAKCNTCKDKGWIYLTQGKQTDCPKCKGNKVKILDTHLGSGSIAIACHDYGFELTACELDKEYYDKAIKRISNHVSQQKLF
jgi:site-specific DNA-methyltransferase (adenine-specific)